jgi:TolB-like protein/Flp pilus assembly protein TadD
MAVGTASYMSPEQALGRPLDHRSDLFSLGVVLYEMVTRTQPFKGETSTEVWDEILHKAPTSPIRLNPEVPDDLVKMIDKCLEKDPGIRCQTARELVADLNRLKRTSNMGQPAIAPHLASRSPTNWVVLAVGATLVAAVLVWQITTNWQAQLEYGTATAPGGPSDLAIGRPSIAILPFANRSDREQDKHFTDGIHDEVRTRLSRISGLRVLSAAAVNRSRGNSGDAQAIAAELGVRYLLEGSGQRTERRVRVNVDLSDARSGEQLWGETYDRELSAASILDLQSEIARAVARELRATLSVEEIRRLAYRSTDNLKAYELYLRAFKMGNDFEEPPREVMEETQRLLEEAVEEDPEFALAYAELGSVHGWFVLRRWDYSPTRREAAKQAAFRAFELDPELPESHFSLGTYYYRVEKDYRKALEEFRKAEGGLRSDGLLALLKGYVHRRAGEWDLAFEALEAAEASDPSSTVPLFQLGILCQRLRRFDDAYSYFQRVEQLEPWRAYWIKRLALYRDGNTAPWTAWAESEKDFYSLWYLKYLTRNWEGAHGALDELAKMGSQSVGRIGILWVDADTSDRPNSGTTQVDSLFFEGQDRKLPISLLRAFTDLAAGRNQNARSAFQSATRQLEAELPKLPDDERVHKSLSLAYAGLGMRDEALLSANKAVELMPMSRDAFSGAFYLEGLAQVHAMLGQADAAVEQLEIVLSNPGEATRATIRMDPRYDLIRDDPRFQALISE